MGAVRGATSPQERGEVGLDDGDERRAVAVEEVGDVVGVDASGEAGLDDGDDAVEEGGGGRGPA